MKRNGKNRLYILAVVLMIILGTAGYGDGSGVSEGSAPRAGAQIFLYGEEHGMDKVIEKEFELWHEHYHNDGMRHLFLEFPYYSCELLNI